MPDSLSVGSATNRPTTAASAPATADRTSARRGTLGHWYVLTGTAAATALSLANAPLVQAQTATSLSAEQSETATRWFVSEVGSVGLLMLQFLMTVVIAAILYANGESAAEMVRRFALPPILGYLVVGMILGPHALGLASDAEAVAVSLAMPSGADGPAPA